MAYPEHLLTDDEVVLLDFHPHWRVLTVAFAWILLGLAVIVGGVLLLDDTNLKAIALLVGLLVIGFGAVPKIVSRQFTHYILTTERLITRGGIISKSGVEIPLEQINNVTFSQSPVERLLGYGDCVLESAGEMGRTSYANIPDPEAFQSEVYRAREARKIHIEGGGNRAADPTEQLHRLAQLRDSGALSDEEFQQAKARLLRDL